MIDPVLWREFRGEVQVALLFAAMVFGGLLVYASPDLMAWIRGTGVVCR